MTLNQLAYTGPMDAYLSAHPEASLFKYNYKRLPNHASEYKTIEFNEKPAFGKTLHQKLPFLGDLIRDYTLAITLPPLIPSAGSTWVGYTNMTGHSIVEWIELWAGSELLDRRTSLDMEIMDYLSTPMNMKKTRDKEVGRYDTVNVLPDNAVGITRLLVPVPFFFCKASTSSFPLISLYMQELYVRVKLRSFDEITVYDGPVEPMRMNPISVEAIVEYVHLTEYDKLLFPTLQRKDYPDPRLPKELTYLVEQYQTQITDIGAGTIDKKVRLEFNKCVKEILFAFVETESLENNDHFNFGLRSSSNQSGEFIVSAGLDIDGQTRFDMTPENFWRQRSMERYHTHAGDRNIYCMSFAASPEMNQPSGSMNLSLFDNVTLNLQFIEDLPECKLYVIAVTYNVLKMTNGQVGFVFLS